MYAVPLHLVGQLSDEPLEAARVLAVEAGQDRCALRRGWWPYGQVAASVRNMLGRHRQGVPAAATLCTFAQQAVPVVARVQGWYGRQQDDSHCSWI